MKLALAVLLFSLLIPAKTWAHEWYSGRRDPIYRMTTCCGGNDCAPLPAHAISFTPGGDLRVTLSLEEARRINPARLEPFDEVIPFERVQTAEDGRPHICLMSRNLDERQGFFCIFLPPNG